MKKAISLFLAVSVICFASSVMAATVGSVSRGADGSLSPRNNKTTFYTGAYNGTGGRNISEIPCFRTGDVIYFTVSALTSDKQLTVISYKYGADSDGLVDAEVQYINQYTGSASQTIAYTIRNQDAGIYVLKINDSVVPVATFYYKVGDPTATFIHDAELAPYNATAYRMVEFDGGWSIGFVGIATMSSADVKFSEVGAKPGFSFTGGKFGDSDYLYNGIDGADLDDYMDGLVVTNGKTIEINGSYSVIYGTTIWNVPDSAKSSIVATAVVDAN